MQKTCEKRQIGPAGAFAGVDTPASRRFLSCLGNLWGFVEQDARGNASSRTVLKECSVEQETDGEGASRMTAFVPKV